MSQANVLVTGGAGYIGSHCVRRLREAGFGVVVIDNLYSGHRWAVPEGVPFVEGNAGDASLVLDTIRTHSVAAVLHFAGHIVVPESVDDPLKYYGNNSSVSRNLIDACVAARVEHFIFSSTAAVYGEPDEVPIRESTPLRPMNPYGSSKLITEWMLRDTAASAKTGRGPVATTAPNFRFIALRYFNVAGARPDGTIGQATPEATHLVKIASEAACGLRPSVSIFGTDYPTRDGTCIRDYIHVEDLAEAHVLAVRHLLNGGDSGTFNVGYGTGFTVREVLETMQAVTGIRLNVKESGRRPGDPAALVADSTAVRRALGWAPRYDDLGVICDTAYRWERSRMAKGSDQSL
jgi:UDP-glucose 4-epimerase